MNKTITPEAAAYLKDVFGVTFEQLASGAFSEVVAAIRENADDDQLSRLGENVLDKQIADALDG